MHVHVNTKILILCRLDFVTDLSLKNCFSEESTHVNVPMDMIKEMDESFQDFSWIQHQRTTGLISSLALGVQLLRVRKANALS